MANAYGTHILIKITTSQRVKQDVMVSVSTNFIITSNLKERKKYIQNLRWYFPVHSLA